MKIFSINSNTDLSDRLVGHNETLTLDTFSDGEHLPIFKKSIRGENIYLLCNDNTDSAIMKTLLTIDAAKRSGVNTINLIWPCLPYSRQDKVDHIRSSIGAKLFADMLQVAGINKLFTIDLHASSIMGFYDIEVIHMKAAKIFAKYINEVFESTGTSNVTIVSPDQGGVKRATDFGKKIPNSEFAMINKKRLKPNEVATMELVGNVTGRDVIIVDDMCDTGGTLSKAAELIMEHGAKSVRAVCTHGILSGKAYENINDSVLTELIVSDSVQVSHGYTNKIRVISSVDLIRDVINRVDSKQSVESVYE